MPGCADRASGRIPAGGRAECHMVRSVVFRGGNDFSTGAMAALEADMRRKGQRKYGMENLS